MVGTIVQEAWVDFILEIVNNERIYINHKREKWKIPNSFELKLKFRFHDEIITIFLNLLIYTLHKIFTQSKNED